MEAKTYTDLRATPRCTPNLEMRTAGGELLVHEPNTGHIHVLNATAGLVLKRCDGSTTLAHIVDDIVAVTNAEIALVELDVARICADFRRKHLIS